MTQLEQEKMFDPFFTSKGDRGTGLGLVVVRRAVAKWGGKIEVQSAAGRGTEVIVRIPVVEGRSRDQSPARTGSGRSEGVSRASARVKSLRTASGERSMSLATSA